jgi:acetyl-CoA carboxylase carboxyltransferase component
VTDSVTPETPLNILNARIANTLDEQREEAAAKRHAKGYRTARENLTSLVDPESFVEYGQLAVAAQRSRRSGDALLKDTAADGVITGTGTINARLFGKDAARCSVIINDYSVLAGTQGFFHHHKIDRVLDIAEQQSLPVVMYTEGGGGRPGDTDVLVSMAGLNYPTFHRWAALTGKVPRIAVNNGYCFAGNAALFGAADIRIATRSSWIGMAGPAMIEGGGLGQFAPTDIGPLPVHEKNGVVDIVAEDEAHATVVAQRLLSYAQGPITHNHHGDQTILRDLLPANRRMAYDVRKVVNALFDTDSVTETRPCQGRAVMTAFARIDGKPVALLASDCRHLAGAIDNEAAEKCSDFLAVANRWQLPVVSLVDTPGFMVGPDSEAAGAPRAMGQLFNSAAQVSTPWVTIFLRRGYGLGAMALAGGSFARPTIAASWPQGEFGGMGLEGAVKLGFRQELEATPEGSERDALFAELLEAMYEKGRATEAASYLELDAVIDPADTRRVILSGLAQA